MKCKPLYFKGTEGVVELTQWFERMETVFRISNCSAENQIKFATCTLLAGALTWWNTHVMTVTHDVAYSMTWVNLKKKMTDKYCPRNEMKKLEAELWNLKVIGTDVVKYNQRFQELALLCVRMFPEEADKIERYVGGLPDMIHGKHVTSQKPKQCKRLIEMATGESKTAAKKRQKPEGVLLLIRGGVLGSAVLMERAWLQSAIMITIIGHIARDCRGTGNVNNNNNQKGTGSGQKPTCFECGALGTSKRMSRLEEHQRQTVVNQAGNDWAPSEVYVVGNAGQNTDMSLRININEVELADGRIIGLNTILKGCTLNFLNHQFNINLMPVELGSFDAIIGMDWLAKHQAVIACAEKVVRIPWKNKSLIIHGDGSTQGNVTRLNIISCTKTQKYIEKGFPIFLAHVTTKEIEDKSEERELWKYPSFKTLEVLIRLAGSSSDSTSGIPN
ncbi:putative reverse transcriptase domain-containing protein [Tanacetum coccineum]